MMFLVTTILKSIPGFIFFLNRETIFILFNRFDLVCENQGIDAMALKEPAVTQRINGCTEEWKKDMQKMMHFQR